MIRNLFGAMTLGALLLAGLGAATAADATVYVGTRTINTTGIAFNGPATISISVTTDGTLGTLTAANITDWRVVIDALNPNDDFTFTPATSGFQVTGTALSASATSLTFDFGATAAVAQFYQNPLDAFEHFYCFQTHGACFGGGDSSDEAIFAQFSREGYSSKPGSGLGVLGIAAVSAVPEPSTWAMMLLGFGLVGAVARRRRDRLVLA